MARTTSSIEHLKDEEKLDDFIGRLKERTKDKNNVKIEWPYCHECDIRIYDIALSWDRTEKEKEEQDNWLKDCEESSRKRELQLLAELKAKYETTS